MFNHSHIRHFSSVFVSLRDFQLITQNSSENIASRQSRCIYVNDESHGQRAEKRKCQGGREGTGGGGRHGYEGLKKLTNVVTR